jgi:hypothetical protein
VVKGSCMRGGAEVQFIQQMIMEQLEHCDANTMETERTESSRFRHDVRKGNTTVDKNYSKTEPLGITGEV